MCVPSCLLLSPVSGGQEPSLIHLRRLHKPIIYQVCDKEINKLVLFSEQNLFWFLSIESTILKMNCFELENNVNKHYYKIVYIVQPKLNINIWWTF